LKQLGELTGLVAHERRVVRSERGWRVLSHGLPKPSVELGELRKDLRDEHDLTIDG
jgi:hypothetical protein